MDHLPGDTNEYYAKSFVGLKLSAITIAENEFEDCEFDQCDFSRSNLARCKFIDCRFTGCDLSLINIEASHFRGVEFVDCKVAGVNWTKAHWPRLVLAPPLHFRKCVIDDSSFFGLSLAEVVIEECKAREVDLREANFSGARFSYSDLTNSLFGRTSLRGADFTEATGYNIDIFNNDITNARFSRYEALRLLDSLSIDLVD